MASDHPDVSFRQLRTMRWSAPLGPNASIQCIAEFTGGLRLSVSNTALREMISPASGMLIRLHHRIYRPALDVAGWSQQVGSGGPSIVALMFHWNEECKLSSIGNRNLSDISTQLFCKRDNYPHSQSSAFGEVKLGRQPDPVIAHRN
jgi:hypothetical protein